MIELGFNNTDSKALFLLPKENADFDDVCGRIEDDKKFLVGIINQLKNSEVNLTIPKFTCESRNIYDVNSMSKEMKDFMDYFGINYEDTAKMSYIHIDEEGVVALTYSTFSFNLNGNLLDSGPEKYTMQVNRPFVFIFLKKHISGRNEVFLMIKIDNIRKK